MTQSHNAFCFPSVVHGKETNFRKGISYHLFVRNVINEILVTINPILCESMLPHCRVLQ